MAVKMLLFPLFLILSLAVFFMLGKPEWDKFSAERATLQKVAERKQALSGKISKVQAALSQYEGLKSGTKQLINNAIPADQASDDLITEIERNGQRKGVFVSKINLGKSKKEKSDCSSSAGNLDASMGVEGTASSAAASGGDTAPAAGGDGMALGDGMGGEPMSLGTYCPKAKIATEVELEAVGTYLDVRNFIQDIYSLNRVTVIEEFEINSIDKDEDEGSSTNEAGLNEGEGGESETPRPQIQLDSLVGIKITFKIFQKEKDSEAKLSEIEPGTDDALDGLLSGNLDKDVIEQFQKNVTSSVFLPVSSGQTGKTDLFREPDPREMNN
jgi:Tfp pilus assembly protein PilO